MKMQKIVIGIAAALLASANLGLIYHAFSSAVPSAAIEQINGVKVTELPQVNVFPTADERRAAEMLSSNSVAGIMTLPVLGGLDHAATQQSFNLIGSQLAMPYYSFGNTFGRISKE